MHLERFGGDAESQNFQQWYVGEEDAGLWEVAAFLVTCSRSQALSKHVKFRAFVFRRGDERIATLDESDRFLVK